MTTLEKLTSALCLAVAAAAGDAQTPLYSYTVAAGGYAPNGNVTGYTDSVTGTWTMQYDALNRLQNATASAGAYQGINLQWQYDSFGNRLGQTRSGHSNAWVPVDSAPTYNPNNQMTSSPAAAPTYDAAGNLTFDGQATQVLYDAENRVCATMTTNGPAGITQYIYNAEGQRVAKGHPGTPPPALTCADTNNFVATATYVLGPSGEQMTEFDGTGAWQHTNVFNGGQLLATYDTRGLHFPQTDPLGTVRVQVSDTGAPEESCASLPFGDGLTCTGITDPTEHHFTGKERDTESGGTNGLDYFRARYYSSNMGRFMSPDWADKPEAVPYSSLDNPQSLNLYSYVNNNPLGKVDADGHSSCNNTGSALCNANSVSHAIVVAISNGMDAGVAMQLGLMAQQQKTLPDNPSGLGDGWKDVTPQGGQNPKIPQRFRGPKGSEIEFDPANPDKSPKTWGGKNHWHEVGPDGKREDGHLAPGSAIPGPDGAPDARVQLPSARQIGIGIGGAAAGYLIYRGLRMLPSIVIPPLWPTIPLNAAIP